MSGQSKSRWADMYQQVPLSDVRRHFENMSNSPFLMHYLTAVLELCPVGGRTLETGIGSGYGAIWLSRRNVAAEGIDYSPTIVERAKQVNNILGGEAAFRTQDLFSLYGGEPRYDVIHHQGVLEHFIVPEIRAALAQQVASADYVVFSVPSVYYPFDAEFGDERFLPLSEWERIVEPFDVVELKYYGDPQNGEKEQILCVLRGQKANDELCAMMHVPDEPFPAGITAIVHTRNEAKNIADCLKPLIFCDQVIVCDMESTDDTVKIARAFTEDIIHLPLDPNFDRGRNVSAHRANFRHIIYVDADERIPASLGVAIRQLLETQPDSFEGMRVPFQHFFSGHWMQCLYPGYTAPRLFKNGRFVFNPRLHSGAKVDGRETFFPADDPGMAVKHYSFDTFSHYLDKLNRYTDGESQNMHRDGHAYHWQSAVQHFVQDFKDYYDKGQAGEKDGVHGFTYSFFSAFYRFMQHSKLFERRDRAGQLQPFERAVPSSVEEVLAFALAVARQKAPVKATPLRIDDTDKAGNVAWCGPLLDPSGYGEESRNLLLALDSTGTDVAGQAIPWSDDVALLTKAERTEIDSITARPVKPGFIQIVHNFPTGFYRHPGSGIVIGRTMFETDRLPKEWVDACNKMDYVWVPSAFNKRTFAQAGVASEKLVVIPECMEPAPYRRVATSEFAERIKADRKYTFLSIFDWTLHKGWDVLVRAFYREFKGDDAVSLILKVWSTNGYTHQDILDQAVRFANEQLSWDILADSRIRFAFDRFDQEGMSALYRAVDCYVMPSRGEGWGRPYMEAMATGLPVIATNWSGNTEFMNESNSFPVDYELQDVPEAGWREVGTYKGHRWAEPSLEHLMQLMRTVYEDRDAARVIGVTASADIATKWSRQTVGKLMADELARIGAVKEGEASVAVVERLQEKPPSPSELPSVRWEGSLFQWHSLAHVNRELCLRLIDKGVDLAIIPGDHYQFSPADVPGYDKLGDRVFKQLAGPTDVHVRHFFPPRFESPEEGQFVLMQPWEYGSIPTEWVQPIKERVSEVWCNSTYVQKVYADSGVPAEKLKLVPLGVDTAVFNPSAPKYVFTDEPGAAGLNPKNRTCFTFLFVGGSIQRKGIDILLDAYIKGFSSYESVRLVIKDTGTKTVYRDSNARERILELANDASRPKIIYIENDLSAHQLAGLYTAADCLVQPYRGEGFCLPALEAMAAGVPVIVPEGGPTDDFIDDTVGYRLPAARKLMPEGTVGRYECVLPPWMFEIDPEILAEKMREIAMSPSEATERGQRAAARVRSDWTWDKSAHIAEERLMELTKAAKRKLEPVKERPRVSRKLRTNAKLHFKTPLLPREPRISLCMIARDEERVLADCLASISPHVDEIIFVDTGSKDRTVEIAESFGARVFHIPWDDNFAGSRNVSLSHATGNFILWMDADDTIPEHCAKQLKKIAMLADKNTYGFIMQVHIPAAPGESGFTVVDHVKLFRNLPGLRFEGRIHEQILESIHREGGTIERTNLYVVHSGYDYSPEGQKKKRIRDLTILEKDLAERPDHPFVLFNIGMTAFHMKDFDKAIPALERSLSLCKPRESIVRKLYAMRAGCALETGDITGALSWVQRGLTIYPRDPELLFRAGIVFDAAGDLNAAVQHYAWLLNEPECGHIDSIDISMTTYKAHYNLATVYVKAGRTDLAEQHLRRAVQIAPDFNAAKAALTGVCARRDQQELRS